MPSKLIMSALIVSACLSGPTQAADDCMQFATDFNSVRVDVSALSPNYLYQPLPESMRKLEAGYDSSCIVGGVADIDMACPVEGDLRSVTIIRDAPVIWTDPEGFTVVIISMEDHDKLQGLDLFWARCDSTQRLGR